MVESIAAPSRRPEPRPAGHTDDGPLLVAPAPRRPAVLRKRPKPSSSLSSSSSSRLADDASHNLAGLQHLLRRSDPRPPQDSSPSLRSGHTPRPSGNLSPIPSHPDEERMSEHTSNGFANPAVSSSDSNGRSTAQPGSPPVAPSAMSVRSGTRSRYISGIDKLRNTTSPISRQTYLTNPLEKRFQVTQGAQGPGSPSSTTMDLDEDPETQAQHQMGEAGQELQDILARRPGNRAMHVDGLPQSRLLSKLEHQGARNPEPVTRLDHPDVAMDD